MIVSPGNRPVQESGSITSTRITSVPAIVLVGTLVGLLSATMSDPSSMELLMVVALVLVGSLGLIWQMTISILSRRWKVDFFSPAIYFPILYGLYYGVGSLVYSSHLHFTITVSEYTLYFVGLFGYYGGILAASMLPWPRRSVSSFTTSWPPSRLKYAILGILGLGTIGLLYAISRIGVPVLSANVEDVRFRIALQLGGFVSYLINSIEIALVLLFTYALIKPTKKSPVRDPRWVALVLFAVLALMGLGHRRRVFGPLAVAVVLYHYLRKRLGVMAVVFLGTVAFLLLIFAAFLRQTGGVEPDQALFARLVTYETVRGADALSKLVEVFPSQFDFFGWHGALLPFAALAPGRQRLLGDILKEDIFGFGFRGGAWVPTLLGWFYVNFGPAGISFGMPVVGLIIGALYQKMRHNPSVFSITLYSYIAIYYLVGLRGGFLELWPLYVVGMLFIVDVYSRIRLRSVRVTSG